jgi:uncharacterized protein YqgV (UPF0045/DUF77 family)
MFSDPGRARRMGRNGRKTVQERFTWDTITEQMLAIYQGFCPDSVELSHRPVDSVQAALAEPPCETPWTGALEDNSLAVIDEKGMNGPHIHVQARLQFCEADADGQVDDALTACQSSLARSGLDPQRQDHTLTIRGDWETVLAALKRYGQYRQRIRVHHEQSPDVEILAVPAETSTDDLVLVTR